MVTNAGMTPAPQAQRMTIARLVDRLLGIRFVRFGTVGASGTVVNLAVLYSAQELLFAGIEPARLRLNISLALAIFLATINNFSWNRAWTWRDRRIHVSTPLVLQFAQYALASWVGILLQFAITNVLATGWHYIAANLVAILVASIFNFAANDLWTFGRLKMWFARRR